MFESERAREAGWRRRVGAAAMGTTPGASWPLWRVGNPHSSLSTLNTTHYILNTDHPCATASVF